VNDICHHCIKKKAFKPFSNIHYKKIQEHKKMEKGLEIVAIISMFSGILRKGKV
jgi:hypothetical protein